jgi:hypothetical protein
MILSNNFLKNDVINNAGKSTELAPLYFTCKDASTFLLYSLTNSPNFADDNSSPR